MGFEEDLTNHQKHKNKDNKIAEKKEELKSLEEAEKEENEKIEYLNQLATFLEVPKYRKNDVDYLINYVDDYTLKYTNLNEESKKRVFSPFHLGNSLINYISKNMGVSYVEKLRKYPSNSEIQNQASLELIEKWDCKKVEEEETIYYFNEKTNSYDILTPERLKLKLKEEYDKVVLTTQQAKNILSAIACNDTIEDEYWNLKNGFLNTTNFNFESTENKREKFTVKKIGFDTKDCFELLSYDENIELLSADTEDITLVEKTLREILIPKNNLNNTNYFIDFLQRAGACFLDGNPYKTATMYYGDGNNGKDILEKILELVFNSRFIEINANKLVGDFNYNQIRNKNVICIQELNSKTFTNEVIAEIKKRTSPENSETARKIHSDESITIRNVGMFFLFTNVIPSFDMSDNAFLTRLDIVKLVNTFVSQEILGKNQDKNYYLINNNLYKELEEDIKGLSWFVSASIKAFKEMLEDKTEFRCKQTFTETIELISGENHLENFMLTHIKITGSMGDSCTANEIKEMFETWKKRTGHKYEVKNENISIDIGYSMKNLFKDNFEKKRFSKGTEYCKVKLLNFEDVDFELNQIYVTNEDNFTETETKQLGWLDMSEKNVFNDIKKGNNTYLKLKNKYKNIDVRRVLKDLIEKGLIYKDSHKDLKSY